MKTLLFFLAVSFFSQCAGAQNWIVLRDGGKIATEWVSRAKGQVEYLENGNWKVLPSSQVKRIHFQPGKLSFGFSSLFTLIGDYRERWMQIHYANVEGYLPVVWEVESDIPFMDVWIFGNLEYRIKPAIVVGGQIGYVNYWANFYNSYYSPQVEDLVYYSSSSDWSNLILFGYGKWFDPTYHFFVTGGLGVEHLEVYHYDQFYAFGINATGNAIVKKLRPSVMVGAGLYLVQSRRHALFFDIQGRYSGNLPFNVFDQETNTFEKKEKILLLPVVLRLSYNFKIP